MKKHRKTTILLFCLFSLLSITNFVFALEINYPRIPISGVLPPQDFVKNAPQNQIISLYALYFFNLIIWLSGIIAFGVLIYGGFRYLTSAGNPERITAAREQIISAFFGILILLSSYIVLQVLNPYLIRLEIPDLKEIKPFGKTKVSGLSLKPLVTSIDTEIPVGRILEDRVFATSTMLRIKDNATTTLKIAKEIERLAKDLSRKTDSCVCEQTQSICPPCTIHPPSTSDPCNSVRGDIERIQQEILDEIDNLREEQKKTTQETSLLRAELTKVARVKNYLPNECRLWTAKSLSEFLIKVDNFKKNGKLRQIKFWDNLTSIRQKDQTRDWTTFYCPVGGTKFTEQPLPPALESPSPEIPGEYTAVVESCPTQAPVGDILDRAERTGNKLAEQMLALLQKGDELIDAVDELNVSVSECSSRNCFSNCVEDPFGDCIILPPIGSPCFSGTISRAENHVADIVEEIGKIVKGQDVGILPLIDQNISLILQEWNTEVWITMQQCVTKSGDKVLLDTQRAIGALDPQGTAIRTACESEQVFLDCQEECYLEKGQEKYTECLNSCLAKKASNLGSEQIAFCRNRLNFFCCNVNFEPVK